MSSAPAASGDDAGTYGPAFFDKQAQASHRSADVILPVVFDLLECTSVVDVGCGVGPWLKAAADRGIDEYLGVDGAWVPTDQLAIPAGRFHAHDLRQPLHLGREFDLAVCVEVAEHLPADAAATLVGTLTRLAPVVLFSAAVPDQGGDGHINEQWPAYWAELFATHGYLAHDCVRLPVWHDERADWWYRQNVLLYADRARRPDGLREPVELPPALIHPGMVHAILTRAPAPAPAGAPADLRHACDVPRSRGRAGGLLAQLRAAGRAGWHRVRPIVRRSRGADR